MNRGSAVSWLQQLERLEGFNEAPIHESGKYQDERNEVPNEPSASMRPRFMNRGSIQHRLWGGR